MGKNKFTIITNELTKDLKEYTKKEKFPPFKRKWVFEFYIRRKWVTEKEV
jgi:hypothetical protein